MKVLLISYYFPPDGAVGALRTGRIVRALADEGHEVEVIAAGEPAEPTRAGGVRVHRVRRLKNAREWALALRGLLRRRTATRRASAAGPTGWVVPENVPAWKRFLVSMALLPDDQQGFILPAFMRAIRVIRQDVDLVYTSGPPHSVHVVGLLLKALTRVRWAAEFRDPWTDNARTPRYARSDTALAIKRFLERRTFRAADHIIAVSEAAGRVFREKLPEADRSRIVVARNGVLLDAAPAPPPADPPARIVYLGSLYHQRDPRPFLHAVANLLRQGARTPADLRIDFYGECRIYRGESVQDAIHELGLEHVVRLHDAVQHREVSRIMRDAHVLLLLAQSQPLQIPAKLYEYFAAGRTILAFADHDGETALMLRQLGGHFVVPTDAGLSPAEIASVVEQSLRSSHSIPTVDSALLQSWSTDVQMRRLVTALTES